MNHKINKKKKYDKNYKLFIKSKYSSELDINYFIKTIKEYNYKRNVICRYEKCNNKLCTFKHIEKDICIQEFLKYDRNNYSNKISFIPSF